MSEADRGPNTPDETLVANARSGDQGAFAELWRRHYRSGVRVARQFTSSIDADDLVSEAYTRIYQRVLAGGGPTGAFRPYLYTTIRNLASSWGAASRHVQVDDIQDFEDPSTIDDPAANALDRTLTARAFRSLPERWQSVLWYTEVEGMDPHEVAPILGMSANGVAALSYRAREGLRKAWLQAHVSEPGASEACRWTMSHLGESARHGLSSRDLEKVMSHLASCTRCSIISEEVEEVGSHLALVMVPILLGGVAGGVFLSSLGHGGAVAAGATVPAVPASFAVLAAPAAVAPVVTAGLALGAATGVSALVGSIAVVAAVGGGLAIGLAPAVPNHSDANSTHVASPRAPISAGSPAASGPADRQVPVRSDIGDTAALSASVTAGSSGGMAGVLGHSLGSTLGSGLGSALGPASHLGPALDGTVGGVKHDVETLTTAVGKTTTTVVNGTGTPGATVVTDVGGVVGATTRVASDGRFTLPLRVPLSLDTAALGDIIHLAD